MYIVLINKEPMNDEEKRHLIQFLLEALGNGYTYQSIRSDILKAFHNGVKLSNTMYRKKVIGNLLKQGVMYYHKELKLINSTPIVNHDIDSGIMTSNKIEFYVEPVASYTIEDLLDYFYSKNMADTVEYNRKRMSGMFKHMIDKYGIDKVLFMIEACARMFNSEHKIFSLSDFDSYSSTASQYLEEIKNNCKYSGGDKYVPRKRVLFS